MWDMMIWRVSSRSSSCDAAQSSVSATPTTDERQSSPPAVAPSASPFSRLAEKNGLSQQTDDWFLLQFPTRLPPLPSSAALSSSSAVSVEEAQVDPASEVSTRPLRTDGFDNSLQKAAGGRIGKFLVHASGKTVLVLEGCQDGLDCRMDVTEGLSCSFRQQAVIVNKGTKQFIPIGDVGKTVVVTPDIESAFS